MKEKRKSLLFIHPSDELYGADRVLLEIIQSSRFLFDIEVWLPTDVDYPDKELSNELERLGIRFRNVDIPVLRREYFRITALPSLIGRLFRVSWNLLKYRPDVIYLNTSATALVAPVGKLIRAKVVLHLHEYLSGQSKVLIPLLNSADLVVAVSNAILEPLPAFVVQKTVVVYNGFELPNPQKLPAISSDGKIILLMASRWNAWKGHELLFEAWNQLSRQDLELWILGAPPPSGKTVDVIDLVNNARNKENIKIIGKTDDVLSYIQNCHVVLVPSVQPDPLPTIAIEGLAAGRLVLGSRIGGLPEICGDAGILVQAGDLNAWKQALEEVDEEQVLKYSLAAGARFDNLFTQEVFREKISQLLLSLN